MFDSAWLYHCGHIRVPQSILLTGDDITREPVRLPFMALALEHEEHGVVLLDAPYGHEGPKNMGGPVGALLGASLLTFKPSWSVIPRLEEMGYRSAQVDHVLMTHMHYDHTGGMKELGHAAFHVSRKEWRAASTMTALGGLFKGYAVSDYRALRAKMTLFDVPESYSRHHPGHDVFGDGSVVAVSLPGHAPGHVGYLIAMRDGRTLFHVGDAVFDRRQITARYGLGAFPKRAAYDLTQAAFTMSELQRYHKEHPDGELLCAHDVALGERCMDGPIKL